MTLDRSRSVVSGILSENVTAGVTRKMKSPFSFPSVLKTLESYTWSSEIAGVMSNFAAAARETGNRMPIAASAASIPIVPPRLRVVICNLPGRHLKAPRSCRRT